MFRKKILTIMLVPMLLEVCPVNADTVWTSGHHEIIDGDIYGEIWMYNDCTLDILGGDIIYVDWDANGFNNGTSWDDAYTYLQDALADANSAEKPVEIRVAQGMYRPDRSSTEPNGTGDRTATFQLINGVTLKGGYAGPRMSLSGADPNARDIDFYETVLSGDLNGDDIDVNDPSDLLDEPTRAENSYHVVTGRGTDETAVLDGFIVTAGNADGPWKQRYNSGGGMYNTSSGSMVTIVRNCIFTKNSAGLGGGMCNYNASPTLTNLHLQQKLGLR